MIFFAMKIAMVKIWVLFYGHIKQQSQRLLRLLVHLKKGDEMKGNTVIITGQRRASSRQ
jgi:hypothetical protein